MIRVVALSLAVVILGVPIARGQQTKEFPADKCAMTLPGEDWEWLDPTLIKKTKLTALAKSPAGLGFSLEIAPIDPKETLVAQSNYTSFEGGYLKSTKAEKLFGEMIDFHGLPAYRFDCKFAGAVSSVFVVCANNRSYHLSVIDGSGQIYPNDTAKKIFEGFRFTSPPQPVFNEKANQAGIRGEKAELAAFAIVGVCAVVLFGFLIFRRIAR